MFLSYRRDDNEAYNGIVQLLASVLRHRFYAETGVEFETFIDLDMRGGERWHARLRKEIQRSDLFIPIITMAYFQSAYCVEELKWFLDKTPTGRRLVTVLPVVLAGMPHITRHHNRSEVREVAELNCRNAGPAVRSGFRGEAWEGLIDQLLGDLIAAWEATSADTCNCTPPPPIQAVVAVAEPTVVPPVSRESANSEPEVPVENAVDEAVEAARQRVKDRPAGVNAARNLAIELTKVGDAVCGVDPQGALGLYEESLELRRQVAEVRWRDPAALGALGFSLVKVADAVFELDPQRALGLYEESLTLRRQIAKIRPGDIAIRNLCMSLEKVANAIGESDPRRALQLHEEAGLLS